MTTSLPSFQQALQNAAQALQRGDKRAARHWAQIAVTLAPEIEEPWLILAAVSRPRPAIEYLKQALLLNPGSERAMRGLSWAQARLPHQLRAGGTLAPDASTGVAQSRRPPSGGRHDVARLEQQSSKQSCIPASAMSATQPVLSATQPRQAARPALARPAVSKRPGVKKLSVPVLFLILACILVAWTAWPGSSLSALALMGGVHSEEMSGPARLQTQIARPIYSPTPPVREVVLKTTFLLSTATPLPTDTAIPIALSTNVPAAAPPTVSIPLAGTYTVQRGDTLSDIALRAGVTTIELAVANQISTHTTIYAGQVLGIPQGGTVPEPAVQPAPGSDNVPPAEPPLQAGEKYILVDISDQHLYAYEGDTLIYSFVASTGMNNATSVGIFHVQDKIPNAYGATWDLWMPNWLGIYYSGGLENGIHALPILSNGSRLWAGYLGTPISFGCIVLGIQEAQELYDWAEVGTTVEIRR